MSKIKLFRLGLIVERYSLESGCILDLFLCFVLNKANDCVYHKELHKYIQDSACLEYKTSSLFCKQNSDAGFRYGSPDYSVKLSHSSEGKTRQLEMKLSIEWVATPYVAGSKSRRIFPLPGCYHSYS